MSKNFGAKAYLKQAFFNPGLYNAASQATGYNPLGAIDTMAGQFIDPNPQISAGMNAYLKGKADSGGWFDNAAYNVAPSFWGGQRDPEMKGNNIWWDRMKALGGTGPMMKDLIDRGSVPYGRAAWDVAGYTPYIGTAVKGVDAAQNALQGDYRRAGADLAMAGLNAIPGAAAASKGGTSLFGLAMPRLTSAITRHPIIAQTLGLMGANAIGGKDKTESPVAPVGAGGFNLRDWMSKNPQALLAAGVPLSLLLGYLLT